jgi:EAL and modified HD-GYP domain-containing signal transduction protein
MGLFSLLDVMMNRPLKELLAQLHLSGDVCGALLGEGRAGNPLANVHALVLANERAEWETLSAAAGRLGVERERVAELYVDAVGWADEVFQI